MIKVLHVVSSLGGGGVEKMLFEYYCNINRKEILFDFVVHGEKEGVLEKNFLKMGSNVYHVTPKKKSFIKNFVEIKKHIKNGRYDIVVVHQNYSSASALFAAWLCGVKVRVIHSHGYIPGDRLTSQKRIYRKLNRLFATDFAACSPEAATWLYGKCNNAKIIYNAIDVEKFNFDKFAREKIREQLGISDDEICLLQVGRFSKEKNQQFSLEILKSLNDKKYKLILAGEGGTEEEIKCLAEEYKLTDKVVFLGCVNDVNEIMCAGDIFLFPSKHEGFGIVAVEAQISGMQVLASDVIPRSTKISDNIEYLSLNLPDLWIKKIKECDFKVTRENVSAEKFDVKIQAKIYEKYLKNLWRRINEDIFN